MTAFNAFAAYNAERDENHRLFRLINAALFMLEGNQDKLNRHGYDTTAQKEFIAKLRKERFEK